MRVRITEVGNGTHPNEVRALIRTIDGEATVYVHRRSISDGSIDIGYPISTEKNSFLVELPRETANGSWRVWVPGSELYGDGEERAVA